MKVDFIPKMYDFPDKLGTYGVKVEKGKIEKKTKKKREKTKPTK